MTPLGRKTLCLLIAFSLAGCTLSRPLARHAVSYNITVENAQNRMLLLNIVRASERRPMYFTGIASIAAAPSYTLASGEISLTEAITRALEGTTDANTDAFKFPSGSYSNKPTMSIGVLDTQEFVTGILSPVELETVNHYLHQGWRADILAYLLVESIETEFGLIRNDPGDDDFVLFQELVRQELENSHCDLQNQTKKTEIELGVEPSLGDVAKASAAGISLQDLNKGIRATISKKTTTWSLHCARPDGRDFSAYIGQQDLEDARSTAEERLDMALVLRSPQSVIYYLGEILRTIRADDGRIPEVPYDDKGYVPLFWAVSGNSSCATSEVQVGYGGETFQIPGAKHAMQADSPCTNRSMQTLALVSQLVALHKSAKNLPGTPLVRLVGD